MLRWITFFDVNNLLIEVDNLLVEMDNFLHKLGRVVLADTSVVEVVFSEGRHLNVVVDNPVVSLVALRVWWCFSGHNGSPMNAFVSGTTVRCPFVQKNTSTEKRTVTTYLTPF